jgi:hypothetical protein
MKYPKVLPSYKDINTWRVCNVHGVHYGIARPGTPIPYGVDWIADCATEADALERVDYAMESDALMESL